MDATTRFLAIALLLGCAATESDSDAVDPSGKADVFSGVDSRTFAGVVVEGQALTFEGDGYCIQYVRPLGSPFVHAVVEVAQGDAAGDLSGTVCEGGDPASLEGTAFRYEVTEGSPSLVRTLHLEVAASPFDGAFTVLSQSRSLGELLVRGTVVGGQALAFEGDGYCVQYVQAPASSVVFAMVEVAEDDAAGDLGGTLCEGGDPSALVGEIFEYAVRAAPDNLFRTLDHEVADRPFDEAFLLGAQSEALPAPQLAFAGVIVDGQALTFEGDGYCIQYVRTLGTPFVHAVMEMVPGDSAGDLEGTLCEGGDPASLEGTAFHYEVTEAPSTVVRTLSLEVAESHFDEAFTLASQTPPLGERMVRATVVGGQALSFEGDGYCIQYVQPFASGVTYAMVEVAEGDLDGTLCEGGDPTALIGETFEYAAQSAPRHLVTILDLEVADLHFDESLALGAQAAARWL